MGIFCGQKPKTKRPSHCGYQPTDNTLDRSDPPKGGSGLPNKHSAIDEELINKIKSLESRIDKQIEFNSQVIKFMENQIKQIKILESYIDGIKKSFE